MIEPRPNFETAARLVLALNDEQIAAKFSAEELIARAEQFVENLKSDAEMREAIDNPPGSDQNQ
jgi:hypothetical protein